MQTMYEEYMREAIRLSIESVHEGGGPFGSVIVDLNTNRIIGSGKNRVTLHNDPTAHGEIEAIRDAGRNTSRNNFSDCILFTSAEPCPGCLLETIFNAGIKEIYYGNSVQAAATVGFADDKNWQLLETTAMAIVEKAGGVLKQLLQDEAQAGFHAWKEKQDKVEYYGV